MFGKHKNIRYYYWLTLEFVKKHAKIIFLSALTSTITIISIITISPYVVNFLTPQNIIVGIVGSYTINTLPDEITSKISNGLLYINDKGKAIPVLVESWESIENGLIYRFHLKKNILLDDNSFFTARDVNYHFVDVESSVKGDYLIEFKLKKQLSIFPTYLTKPILKYPAIGIGGLYKVNRIKYRYGQIAELSLAPNKKGITHLIYRFYPNESQMITAYKMGHITQMSVTKKSIADSFKDWSNTKVDKGVDYTNLLTIFFNYKNPQLNEKEIRSAIRTGIDMNQFVDTGIGARTSIPPTSWAYNTDIKVPIFDEELARKIVKKDVAATESAKLNFNTYYDYLDVASNINENLNNIGLSTNLNIISYSNTNDFDLLLTYLKVPQDPDQYYYWHSTQSLSRLTGYKNLKVDKLLEDGRGSFSQEERIKPYKDFQKALDDDVGAIFLFYPYIYTITRK